MNVVLAAQRFALAATPTDTHIRIEATAAGASWLHALVRRLLDS
jgi:hypothetical protein